MFEGKLNNYMADKAAAVLNEARHMERAKPLSLFIILIFLRRQKISFLFLIQKKKCLRENQQAKKPKADPL